MKRSGPVPICLHYIVLSIVATAAVTWESVSGEPVNRFRERCSRNAWRDRITSASRLCRSSLPSSTGRGACELWHRFSFLLSTRTTVALAVIFGLCIILNGIPACHKICKMFRCVCRYGVCCVSFAAVMRCLMCSLQCVFLVRQCNVHSLMSFVMCVFALSVVCGMGGPGFTYRLEDPLSWLDFRGFVHVLGNSGIITQIRPRLLTLHPLRPLCSSFIHYHSELHSPGLEIVTLRYNTSWISYTQCSFLLRGYFVEFYRLQLWEDNIKMNIKGIGWELVGWMYLARDGANWGGWMLWTR